MFKSLLKLCIIFTKDFSFFSLPALRNIRWFLYRKYYNAEKLYVDTGVTIVTAHKNTGAYFKCGPKVHIGEDVYIDYSGGIEIDGWMSISEGAKIFTHNHDIHDEYKDWKLNPIKFQSLKIEKYTWIGANALILPLVTLISEGSIIAAGAVLTKSTEPYGVYAGNPAQKIATRKISE